MLKFLSVCVGADVTWLEVALAVSLAGLFYVGLVLALSI